MKNKTTCIPCRARGETGSLSLLIYKECGNSLRGICKVVTSFTNKVLICLFKIRKRSKTKGKENCLHCLWSVEGGGLREAGQ